MDNHRLIGAAWAKSRPWLCPALLTLGLAGCHVETHTGEKNNDVHVSTPFGSVHVQTDGAAAAARVGLTPYPGATAVHTHGDDDGAADVHVSFGNFAVGVHALELETGDPEEKVLAFYRKDLGRYGTVIACRNHEPVGQPARTEAGLTCETDHSHNDDDDDLELRAGSPQRQHVVGVHRTEGKTRIGLVALELPGDGGKNNKQGDEE